jgi:Do/DeqQ family serine protease
MRNRAAVWALSAVGLLLAFVAFEVAITSRSAAQQKQVPPSREMVQYSFAPIARKASPAVVNVYVRRRVQAFSSPFANDPFFRQFFGERFGRPSERVQSSLGSGVIVSPDGTIVTNTHVIKGRGETEIRVALADKREFDARVVVQDDKTDIAILKIEGGDTRFPTIAFEDSDTLEVGDLVLAIGNPFGVGQTVTSGIVSALARTEIGKSDSQVFIQTDAAINPGNSGGALVDTNGNLLGINTAIYSRSGGSMGIGFAIPVSTAKLVMDGIVRDGQVTRGWIGVEPNELNPELAETFGVKTKTGVIITGVLQNGPAAVSGIRPGDVILSVAGKPVGNVSELLTSVAALKPGTASKFSVLRKEETVDVDVTPGVRPKPRKQAQ